MESSAVTRYNPQKSNKRVFPGSSSAIIEPEVIEITPPHANRTPKSKSKALKHKEKQEQSDEEFSRKITELQTELASSNELRQKLERKVQFLEDENYLLENKHKELKETISSILQAKEGFVKAYQESTCEMKRSIESRDRKIATLSEKINSHLLSFDTIQKEASFVKQVVDNANHVVNEKEEIVSQLKVKLEKVCAFENLFVEKIKDLQTKLKNKENEFYRKERVILKLQTQLETAKINVQSQPKIEEISIYIIFIIIIIIMSRKV